MNYAVIEDGFVVDLIIAEAGFTMEGVTLVQSDTAKIGDSYEDGVFTNPPAPPMDNSMRIAVAADYRWQKEVGGIVVSGVTVLTDDRSKLLINGMYALASSEDPTGTRMFISPTGPVEITNAQAVSIAISVGRHVQHCIDAFNAILPVINTFETEQEIFEAIDDAYDTIKSEDITARFYVGFDGDEIYQEQIQ